MGVSGTVKGAALMMVSFATVAGVAAVLVETSARAHQTDVGVSVGSLVSAKVLEMPLANMQRMARGLLITSESVERGTIDQLTDLARLSYLTNGNQSAFMNAMETRISQRRAIGAATAMLEANLADFKWRSQRWENSLSQSIPGMGGY